jgi:hypothetical protein
VPPLSTGGTHSALVEPTRERLLEIAPRYPNFPSMKFSERAEHVDAEPECRAIGATGMKARRTSPARRTSHEQGLP